METDMIENIEPKDAAAAQNVVEALADQGYVAAAEEHTPEDGGG